VHLVERIIIVICGVSKCWYSRTEGCSPLAPSHTHSDFVIYKIMNTIIAADFMHRSRYPFIMNRLSPGEAFLMESAKSEYIHCEISHTQMLDAREPYISHYVWLNVSNTSTPAPTCVTVLLSNGNVLCWSCVWNVTKCVDHIIAFCDTGGDADQCNINTNSLSLLSLLRYYRYVLMMSCLISLLI